MRRIISAGGNRAYVHALAETFSILTGGRHGRRLSAASAARLIEQSVLPYVQAQTLTGKDTITALAECEARGVRGLPSTIGCIWQRQGRPARRS